MFKQSWMDNQPKPEIEEISPTRCFLGAAGILALVLIGIIFVVLGLSL